jgi:hypothetical protein
MPGQAIDIAVINEYREKYPRYAATKRRAVGALLFL